MKLRYAFKRTIANKSAGADKELKPEVPDGMLKKCNACKAAVTVLFLHSGLAFYSYFASAGTSLMLKLILPILSLPRHTTVTLSPRVKTSST